MSEDGNEVCVLCGRLLEDEEDATGISSGVAKENDGFYASDTPWEVVGSCCARQFDGFMQSHGSLTEFIEKVAKDPSMGEAAKHIAYEMNITLGKD